MSASDARWYGTGRRKNAIARVWIVKGSGNVTINHRSIDDYMPRRTHQLHALAPLEVVEKAKAFDVLVNVHGGGFTGQSGAIRMGIARALVEYDAELRPALKKESMLTRDARAVERKKYGQPKARKRFQFSKR